MSRYHLFKQVCALGAFSLFWCSNAFGDNWLGTSSTDWFTALNWDSGIPNSTTDVTVNSTGHSPTISSGGAQARTLILGQTTPGTLIISPGASLHTLNSYIAYGSTISGIFKSWQIVPHRSSKYNKSQQNKCQQKKTGHKKHNTKTG